MSIGAVTTAFSAYAQKIVSGVSNPNTVAGSRRRPAKPRLLREGSHNGDPIARKKLQKLQAQQLQQQQASQPAPAESRKGGLVDHAG